MTTEGKRGEYRPQVTRLQTFHIGQDLSAALERVEGEVSGNGKPRWRYKDGQSDDTIAAKHGVGESTVGDIRLELFGVLKRSDAGVSRPGMFELQASIKRINEQLADFARRVHALENRFDNVPERDRNHVVSLTQNGIHKNLF